MVRGRSTIATIFDVCGRAHIACALMEQSSLIFYDATLSLVVCTGLLVLVTHVVGQLVDGL